MQGPPGQPDPGQRADHHLPGELLTGSAPGGWPPDSTAGQPDQGYGQGPGYAAPGYGPTDPYQSNPYQADPFQADPFQADPFQAQQGYGTGYPAGPPSSAQPGYSAYPAYPAYPTAPASYPGKTLGLVGLILSCVGLIVGGLSLVGLVLSIVGLVQSKNAGEKNGPALAGVIVGAAVTVLGVVAVILYIAILIPLIQAQR